MKAQGFTNVEIGRVLGVSEAAVRRGLEKHEQARRKPSAVVQGLADAYAVNDSEFVEAYLYELADALEHAGL